MMVGVGVNGCTCSLFVLGVSFCCRQFSRLCPGITCQVCIHTEYGSDNTCRIDVLLCIPRGAFYYTWHGCLLSKKEVLFKVP